MEVAAVGCMLGARVGPGLLGRGSTSGDTVLHAPQGASEHGEDVAPTRLRTTLVWRAVPSYLCDAMDVEATAQVGTVERPAFLDPQRRTTRWRLVLDRSVSDGGSPPATSRPPGWRSRSACPDEGRPSRTDWRDRRNDTSRRDFIHGA